MTEAESEIVSREQRRKEKQRARYKKFVEANREHVRRYAREWSRLHRKPPTPKQKASKKAYDIQYRKDGRAHRYATQRAWRQSNKDRLNAEMRQKRKEKPGVDAIYAARCKAKNPDRYRQMKNACSKRIRDRDPEMARAKLRARRAANLESERKRAREYVKMRRATVPQFKLASTMRTRLREAVRNSGGRKSDATMKLVGCSIEFLHGFIGVQFKRGMTWENLGKWHIDHVIPCASFDLTNPDEQRRCFHYTNLRPLWAKENFMKSDKMPGPHQPLLI